MVLDELTKVVVTECWFCLCDVEVTVVDQVTDDLLAHLTPHKVVHVCGDQIKEVLLGRNFVMLNLLAPVNLLQTKR